MAANNVLQEIITTEKTYLQFLECAQTDYEEPLRKNNTVSEAFLKEVFGRVPALIEISKELLRNLESPMPSKSFTYLAPKIESVFADYCIQYEMILKFIGRESMINDSFKSFISKQVNGNTLSGLLLTPVQRVPRYVILLRSLLKETEKIGISHDGPRTGFKYEGLEESLATIEKVADAVDGKIAEYQNTRKLQSIQRRIFGKNVPVIDVRDRWYLGEFNAEKQSNTDKEKSSTKHVFVFSDSLVYCVGYTDAHTEKIADSINQGTKSFRNAIKSHTPDKIHAYSHRLKQNVISTLPVDCSLDDSRFSVYYYTKGFLPTKGMVIKEQSESHGKDNSYFELTVTNEEPAENTSKISTYIFKSKSLEEKSETLQLLQKVTT